MNNYNYFPSPKSPTVNVFDQRNPPSAQQESSQQTSLPTPSSASSTGHYSPDGQFKVVRRRNRVPLSCGPCRNRKLKCNRSSPCENCVKRGDAVSCSYAQPSSRKRQTTNMQSSSTPDDMQNRIARLEGLVLSLMTNGNPSAGPSDVQRALSMDSSTGSMQPQDASTDGVDGLPLGGEGSDGSETDQVVQSLGIMKVDNSNKTSMYLGETHWASVLSDIAEVKNYFMEHKKQFDDQANKVQQAKARMDSTIQGPMFLFGGAKPPAISELLAQMPKRTVADKMIQRYFNAYDPAVHILHPPSWYEECNRFWENPDVASPAWVGQMYAVFCLAMVSFHNTDDQEPNEFRGKSLEMAARYRELAGQCIALADFTRPVTHMIETMVLYMHCEYSRARDTEIAVWILVGMIVRLSMRMGYHRDPKYYSNITPFQGELRRRVWTFIRQADLLFSFQVGQPSMIREGDCDTELPRNLFDDEFDENVAELPPSRPASVPTQVSYMRAKAMMTFAFGKVVERLHMTTKYTYDDLLGLDQSMRNVFAELPPHLRMKELGNSSEDPAPLIMQRYNLAMLYHKAQCVLHRKFLHKARENPRFAQSRRTCIDSSMELLRIQEVLHFESRPRHKLYGMKVFVSSLTATDFLLAAMIVALDLCYSNESEANGSGSGDMYMWGAERRPDMIRALEVAQSIWKDTMEYSMEAYKAFVVLTIMLNKMRSHRSQQGRGGQNPFAFLGGGLGDGPGTGSLDDKPEHSAAMTLGMLSSGVNMGNIVPQFNGGAPAVTGDANMGDMQAAADATAGFGADQSAQSGPNPLNFFDGAMLPGMDTSGAESNIDWDVFESYLQSTNIDLPMSQQQTQCQHQQPWPASVDPSLANPNIDGAQQQANGLNAPNAFMGGSMGM